MGGHFSYYIPPSYPSSIMPIPTNTFLVAYLYLSSGISYGGSQFYGTGNPLHEVPLYGSNIYPHLSNPFHDFFSLKTFSSVMIPLQTLMNQFGGGYYPIEQGQGINQIHYWPAISQTQSFQEPWSQFS